MSAAVYQAGQIKRRRRTKAQVEQLDDQIVEVLEVAKVAEESEREHLERWTEIMSNFDSDEAEAALYG